MNAPERVKSILSDGPATMGELMLEFVGEGGGRESLKGALRRMSKRGEVRNRPMFDCRARRVTVKPVQVWELIA